jgi:carboxypeptidase Taq
MGFDWKSGRLDVSPHPFCTGLSPEDVRITTRYSSTELLTALFGMIHEAGHALYEQGLDAERYGSLACDAVSLGVHESQSRLWENQVGRSAEFWMFWFPRLQTAFPAALSGWSPDAFLRAVNRVEASCIRIEADEVTYGLHVILRYELERGLIEDNLRVEDLPDAWNERMRRYLGLTPSDAAQGVLQDTHWSQGMFGYFPTYVLGNILAAQILHGARRSIPDLSQRIRAGDLLSLREWLREKVHRPGKTLSADEVLVQTSGEPMNTVYFTEYLREKFNHLYEL